jgi:hypothetical protein
MVEIQSKRYDTIQQSLGPASNLHAPGSRCPASLPGAVTSLIYGSRARCDYRYILTCRMSLFLSGFHDGLLSWCSLWSLDAAPAATMFTWCSNPCRWSCYATSFATDGTDGRTVCATGRFLLLQSCRRLMERGKKRTPPTPHPFFGGSQETKFFLGEFSRPGAIIIILNNTRIIFFCRFLFFKRYFFQKFKDSTKIK